MGIDPMTAALRRWPTLALLGLLCACAARPPPQSQPDLAAFLQRRAACDHWRGEVPDPPEPERIHEIEQEVAKYCTGTDAQLAALKQRYRHDPTVLRQLAAFEARIEKTAR
jgi:hypothetical protein